MFIMVLWTVKLFIYANRYEGIISAFWEKKSQLLTIEVLDNLKFSISSFSFELIKSHCINKKICENRDIRVKVIGS